MKKPLYLYGAGGLGKELFALIMALPEWDISGFYDDGLPRHSLVCGKPVLGGLSDLKNTREQLNVIISIGDPRLRKHIGGELRNNFHLTFPVIIHPSAIIMNKSTVAVGSGTIISAGCVLTTEITIGSHALLNLNCTIGHNSHIGSYASLMPGVNVAGNVKVGDAVLIGSGAQLINQVSIGSGSKVGAGSVVIRSVGENLTVVGVPAKQKKSSSNAEGV